MPAPPVITAFPGQAKRALARSSRDMVSGRGSRGAVRGDKAVDNGIVGMSRDDRSARTSRGVVKALTILSTVGMAEASPILWTSLYFKVPSSITGFCFSIFAGFWSLVDARSRG